ncbi:unnamed protein product [Calypogeia fissa]
MQRHGLLEEDEKIEGLFNEEGVEVSLEEVFEDLSKGKMQIEVSHKLYGELSQFVKVNTKYKIVDKKVRPATTPLSRDAKEILEKTSKEGSLRDRSKIGHQFTEETLNQLRIGDDELLTREEREAFWKVISRHDKAFAFTPQKMRCVDPSVVTPMVIFTVPHIPWNLKPISVPKALMPKLIDLLKEKLANRVLERTNAPYSNRWFTIRKKNDKLRFIQDMQPPNKVTIRNIEIGSMVDEFSEEFASRAIYSCEDLYLGYDQFQLTQSNRDIITIRTPLGLLRMCTLPQGATNSVAHMQNAMNKVFQAFIPEKTQPFLDDMPIKGCLEAKKDETRREDGLRQFVWKHI